jgi:hypothetical protein
MIGLELDGVLAVIAPESNHLTDTLTSSSFYVTGPPWVGLLNNFAILLLGVLFHRLRDRDVFAGEARCVFTPGLAVLYLTGAVLFWLGPLSAFAFLFATNRMSWETNNPVIALPALLLIFAYLLVVSMVQTRARAASGNRGGPIATVGQFIRLAYGTAVPAAWRRFRAGTR